jgi:hypothetical protein
MQAAEGESMFAPGAKRLAKRVGVAAAVLALPLIAASAVYAGAPSPGSIHVAGQTGQTVTVSGTWNWAEMVTHTTKSYAGYAIDWGDVTSGNQLGVYHIGDGTPATNVVLQPTSPDRGSSGNWGPASHTYAAPGEYQICVIVYDLGEVKPFKTTGYHSLKATGTSRNSDNSVDQKIDPGAACTKVEIAAPTESPAPTTTATPFESFQGVTGVPSLPSTGTAEDSGTAAPSSLPLILFALSALGSVAALAVARENRRQ